MNTKEQRVLIVHNTLKLQLQYNALPLQEPKNRMNATPLTTKKMRIVKVHSQMQRLVLPLQHLVVVVLQLMLVNFKLVKTRVV